MPKRLLIALSLLFAPAACDAGPESEDDVVDQQLKQAELSLEDALQLVGDEDPDATVIEAAFVTGVDAGFYEVLAIAGEELVVFEVEAERPEVRIAERRRADEERLARARRHARRRLAAAIDELRDLRDGDRITRARLFDREADFEVRGRRGDIRRLRLALAD